MAALSVNSNLSAIELHYRMTSDTLININFIMNKTWQFPGTSSENQSKLNAKTGAKYPMYKHQLCPAEIVLILNAKESSTFLVKNDSRVLQDGSRGTTVLDPSGRLLEEYGMSLIPGSNPSENPVKNY